MQHLAMIMDGNRRWARKNRLSSASLGHKKGVDSVKIAVEFCLKKNIKYLSLYMFSLENFNRSEEEKNYIFNLLDSTLKDNLPEFIKNNISVRFVGDRSYFPKSVVSTINLVEKETFNLKKLFLNFLFCYGARQEIVSSVKKIAKKVKDGLLNIDDINEDTIKNESWLGGIPDPALLIRTGDVCRLSNFLLYQAAYSELIFLECGWPEINEKILQNCVDKFKSIRRNFGS